MEMKELEEELLWVKYLSFMTLCIFVIIIGGVLNYEVMLRNGGKMPVFLSYEYETNIYFSFQNIEEVHYWFLGDIFPLGSRLFSVGDVVSALGFLLIILVASTYLYKNYKLTKKK